MSKEAFLDVVRPLVEKLKDIDLNNPAAAQATIEREAPIDGELVQSIRETALAGLDDGWLLTKEAGGIMFGRATKDLLGFSIDAVRLDRPGPRHRHPNGEIDLCFTTKGDAKFDGHPEGWVVYGPGSTHTPTVTDGEMLILYFLPGAAFEMVTD